MAKSYITVCFAYSFRLAIFEHRYFTSSVATPLGCGGVFVRDCFKFPTESNSERSLKIGQYLVKLWARVASPLTKEILG